MESQLSLYRPTSQITRANRRAASAPVRLERPVFELVVRCCRWSRLTGGAFDITLGALSRCWGFTSRRGRLPDPGEVERARSLTGVDKLVLDPGRRTIAFAREGVMLDFGSLGKGYALERARQALEWHGVERALLHGGTSTVATLGSPPGQEDWKVSIAAPGDPAREEAPPSSGIASLCGQSLSVSAVWGKSFRHGGREYGHVLDGRSGEPAGKARIAAVQRDSPAEADALSTALLVAGEAGREWMEAEFARSPYLYSSGAGDEVFSRGFGDPRPPSGGRSAGQGLA